MRVGWHSGEIMFFPDRDFRVDCFFRRVVVRSLAAHLEPGLADDLEHAVPDLVCLPPDGHEGVSLFPPARLVVMSIVVIRLAPRGLFLVLAVVVLTIVLLALASGLGDLVRAFRPRHDELLVLIL